MSTPLPTKIYLVDRTPAPSEPRERYQRPYGPLRRLYSSWAHVKLFMSAHSRRGGGPTSDFKVYEADVTWREVEA